MLQLRGKSQKILHLKAENADQMSKLRQVLRTMEEAEEREVEIREKLASNQAEIVRVQRSEEARECLDCHPAKILAAL